MRYLFNHLEAVFNWELIPFACFLLLDETKEKDETNESINVELFTTITIKGKVC